MTRDDIIRMAREAGLATHVVVPDTVVDIFEKFASFVAAHEREQSAKVVETYCGAWDDQGHALADCPRCGHCCSQPNQKPVKKMEALFDNDSSHAYADGWNACVDAFSKQRRPWVGLTKEELKQACWESGPDGDTSNREDVVRWTEARLKEKNT